MSSIKLYIDRINQKHRKVLSVFLPAGYPLPADFVSLAVDILNHGADMLEIGIPFSDPIADGPIIQQASQKMLAEGINLSQIFNYAAQIRTKTKKPLILMGYANTVYRYGLKDFIKESGDSGIDGLIIPDVPLEEYDTFWGCHRPAAGGPDIILLTTPTSGKERIRAIDARSRGFVYCVSITGTTGLPNQFNAQTVKNIRRTYRILVENKMLIGFGIFRAADVRRFAPYCDGVIVGSAVIRALTDGLTTHDFAPALQLISELSEACSEKATKSGEKNKGT
jgi:tryptophan synthase alpha chain